MMKKIFILLLAGAMLFLSSCGIIIINNGNNNQQGETTSVTDSTDTSETDTKYEVVTYFDYEKQNMGDIDDLPKKDFDGENVFIAVESEVGNIFNEEGGYYASYVSKRSEKIKEKYNVNLMVIRNTADEIQKNIFAAKKRNETFTNLVLMSGSSIGNYLSQNALISFTTIPHIDIYSDLFNESVSNAYTFNGKTYAVSGSLCDPVETHSCLFVNVAEAKKKGIEIDYKAVSNGAFTQEVFLNWLTSAGKKSLTYSTEDNQILASLMLSMGGSFMEPDDDGDNVLSKFRDENGTIVSYLRKVVSYLNSSTSDDGSVHSVGIDSFISGNSIFMFGYLSDMRKLGSASFKWEVLPLPTYEERDYYSPLSAETPLLAATTSEGNIDTIGYMINALYTASPNFIRTEFMRDMIDNYITSTHTPDMIDIILDSEIVYDAAPSLSSNYSSIRNGTINVLYNSVYGTKSYADLFAKSKTKAANAIKGIK